MGGWIMHFREEPVTPVYRHWMCEKVGCNGELLSTGEGITRLSTRWKHRCGKCGHEDWADATYPRVAYLPIYAIGPENSYGFATVTLVLTELAMKQFSCAEWCILSSTSALGIRSPCHLIFGRS